MNKKIYSIIVYLFALLVGCYAIAVAAMFGIPIIAAEIFTPLWVVITTYLFHLFLPSDKKKCIVAPLIAALIVGAACNAVLWCSYEAGTRPVLMVVCVIAALSTMLFTRGAKQKPVKQNQLENLVSNRKKRKPLYACRTKAFIIKMLIIS